MQRRRQQRFHLGPVLLRHKKKHPLLRVPRVLQILVGTGERVSAGQRLAIIEAMKMMNQIESDKEGKITAILATNGEPVEFGQPLFIIE